MKPLIAILCLLLLVPAAFGQDDGHGHDEEDVHGDELVLSHVDSSGPLFLQSEGLLASEAGGPSAECLSVDTQAGAQTATFVASLKEQFYHVESSTVTLSLAFTQGSNPGSGFRIDGELQQGTAEPVSSSLAYGPGASLASPATMAFEFSEIEPVQGDIILSLALTPTSLAGPLPAVLDVGIQCQDPDSRLYSFEYAVFTEPGMIDDDGHSDEGDISTLYVILIAIGAAVVTLVAGILPLIGRALAPQRLHLFLGITAGLLLSIALVDLIPEAIGEGGGNVAWTIALGVLVLYGVKHLAGETHSHAEHELHPDHHDPDADDEHTDPHAGRFALVAFGALLFHRLVDGLALPGAFAAGGDVGFAASSAILLHQFPDGLAAASVFLAAGWRKTKVLWTVLILAAATPVGSLVGLLFAGIEGALPHLLGLAAATFIFIALAELLPELRAKKYRFIVVVGFLVGYGLTFGIELFAEVFGGAAHGH